MKEMIYKPERIKEVLYDSTIGSYRIVVMSYGTHPCGYVGISATHPLYGKDCDGIDIDVHGGLTFSGSSVADIKDSHWWFGWDYAHACDYVVYPEYTNIGKRYTTEDIEFDAYRVIAQLKNGGGGMTYDKDLSVGLNIELNRKTDLIDEVVAVWEKANYHVNVFDDLSNPGCKWISAWLDEYEVRIYLHDKEWSIEKMRSYQTRITIRHMGLIDETGQILGWW